MTDAGKSGCEPMGRMLERASGRVRMHMPGHKGKLPADWLDSALDQTETAMTDDLFAPCGGIAQAQALYAESAGAENTLFLTGGSTSGMLAMVLSSVREGGRLILPRNAHHSAMSACVWGDIEPVFVSPRVRVDGSAYMDVADVLEAIARCPDAQAVLVTRPDYYGQLTELEEIVRAAHEKGMCVLVDEAHGAHFPWQRDVKSAMESGADLCVQSAHKTLPALTGAAVLHMARGVDVAHVRRVLRMVHTSSPSFLIMRTMDGARAWMDAHGAQALDELRGRIDAFWRALAPGYGNAHAKWGGAVDPLRVVIDVTGRGYTGWEVSEMLTRSGIDAEMADECRVVFIPSVWDEPDWLERAAAALSALEPRAPLTVSRTWTQCLPPRAMRLRRAALGASEDVPLRDAAGRVCAVSAGVYPPGVPLCTPGERFTPEILSRIQNAPERFRFGVEDGCVRCTAVEGEERHEI